MDSTADAPPPRASPPYLPPSSPPARAPRGRPSLDAPGRGSGAADGASCRTSTPTPTPTPRRADVGRRKNNEKTTKRPPRETARPAKSRRVRRGPSRGRRDDAPPPRARRPRTRARCGTIARERSATVSRARDANGRGGGGDARWRAWRVLATASWAATWVDVVVRADAENATGERTWMESIVSARRWVRRHRAGVRWVRDDARDWRRRRRRLGRRSGAVDAVCRGELCGRLARGESSTHRAVRSQTGGGADEEEILKILKAPPGRGWGGG